MVRRRRNSWQCHGMLKFSLYRFEGVELNLQIVGYSSETGKRRFASDCVVGPGDVAPASIINGLRVK
jgi:hypothetical protein